MPTIQQHIIDAMNALAAKYPSIQLMYAVDLYDNGHVIEIAPDYEIEEEHLLNQDILKMRSQILEIFPLETIDFVSPGLLDILPRIEYTATGSAFKPCDKALDNK